MKDAKAPTSRSYQEFLLESLRNAIRKVIEARIRMNALSESAKEHHERLDQMLTKSGGSEIYSLVELLEALGFKLEINYCRRY